MFNVYRHDECFVFSILLPFIKQKKRALSNLTSTTPRFVTAMIKFAIDLYIYSYVHRIYWHSLYELWHKSEFYTKGC
jgi:hypothetical protein